MNLKYYIEHYIKVKIIIQNKRKNINKNQTQISNKKNKH